MAQLQRYTQISHGSGEGGQNYSFVNLAYNEDNESTEDNEREWTLEDEPKFKPRKKRCTKFNVAVAVFILAAGGLAVFLIVKLSQDHEKVYTTPQPGPLGGSTKMPSTTSSLPSTSETLTSTSTTMETSKTTVTMHTTVMTSSTPTAPPTSTSGPPFTSTLSTPSSTQTKTTTPSPTTTTRPSTTSTSPLSTTMLTATTTVQTSSTPTSITKTTLSSVTTAAPQLSTDLSTETTTTISTTTSGTNTTSRSLMTTTSLPEKSTAESTTIITSSTLLPTTTATSNVVITTQEVTTHTTANGTNNTDDASIMFDASMTVTSIAWDENYSNSSSDAYQKLISNFTNQVEEGIKSSEVGSSFSHVTVTAVSPGSVVFDFRIHMTSTSYQSGGSQETITHSVVSTVLVTIVQRAKVNGTDTLLSGVNEANIVVQTVIETTKSLPSTTKMTTALPTATTSKASESTSSQTTATTTTVTTTTMSTTISPCANSTYLSSTLISYCFDSNRLNEVVNATDVVKCGYILSAVDCVLDKIRSDFGINCTNEHKIAALNEFSGIVQLYLGIDPKICDLPVIMPTTMATKTSSSGPASPSPDVMTTSKPTMTTPFPTSISPCNNSAYLSSTLLSHCINSSQISEVANALDRVKCRFILSAVDCVLEKIRLDFGINCTEENKLAALEEFSGIVQSYLLIDPEICVLPIIMSTAKTTSLEARSSSPHTMTTPLTTSATTNPHSATSSTSTTTRQPSVTKTTTTLSSTTTTQSVGTSPVTTRLTATTELTMINPCMNSTYLSSILSQSSCIVDSNQLEEVKNASDEVKCNYISSIVDCVLEGVRLDINITCSDKKKIVALYEIEELGLSYLSINPRTCDLSATNSTTTPSARTTLSRAATTTTITTTPVTTMTTKTTNKLTTPLVTTTTTMKTTPVNTNS